MLPTPCCNDVGKQALMASAIEIILTNDLRELVQVHAAAQQLLRAHAIVGTAAYIVDLTLEEILTNTIRHGYQDAERHQIVVCVSVLDGIIELHFVDDGREFDPTAAVPVDLSVPLEQRRVGGLGLHLVRELTGAVRYERRGRENHLWVSIAAG